MDAWIERAEDALFEELIIANNRQAVNMTAKPKRVCGRPWAQHARPPNRSAARLSFASDIQRWKREWDELQTTPDWRAMEAGGGHCSATRRPGDNRQQMCKDGGTTPKLLQRAWPHHDVKRSLPPCKHTSTARGARRRWPTEEEGRRADPLLPLPRRAERHSRHTTSGGKAEKSL